MIIEGRNAVAEALSANVTIEKLCVTKGTTGGSINELISKARDKRIKIIFCDKAALDRLSSSGRHQGVVAVATEFEYTPFDEFAETAAKSQNALFIILDGVEDPHNLGAIVRVADAVAATGIVIPKHRGSGVTDTAVKVSAGATAHVKIAKVTNVNDAIRRLKEEGVFVYAADSAGANIYKTNLTGNIAIVIGGEGDGVHALTKKIADGLIALPQLGKLNSLNASVAAGAILYECVRQRI
jgi:23S rRNA (guanosine2251-2'-O)-methyltransferase